MVRASTIYPIPTGPVMTMARYLGVDGGGSKTAFALVDSDDDVLARATRRDSYYFNDGFEVVERVLAQGITDICRQAGIDTAAIDAAFFGLPGYGEAAATSRRLDAVRSERARTRPVQLRQRHGLRLGGVAGRRGRHQRHQRHRVDDLRGAPRRAGHRVGGWGELFGDEGSAYWVATRGLNAFSRMSDGRAPRGPLYGRCSRSGCSCPATSTSSAS